MMIPFVGISQQKYITEKGDTLISYTLNENRSIALVFIEGDYYKEQLEVSDSIIINQSLIINDNLREIIDLKLAIDSHKRIEENLLKDYKVLDQEIIKYKKKNRLLKIVGGSSVGLNILLLVLLL